MLIKVDGARARRVVYSNVVAELWSVICFPGQRCLVSNILCCIVYLSPSPFYFRTYREKDRIFVYLSNSFSLLTLVRRALDVLKFNKFHQKIYNKQVCVRIKSKYCVRVRVCRETGYGVYKMNREINKATGFQRRTESFGNYVINLPVLHSFSCTLQIKSKHIVHKTRSYFVTLRRESLFQFRFALCCLSKFK